MEARLLRQASAFLMLKKPSADLSMKTRSLLFVALAVITLAVPTASFAGKKNKRAAAPPKPNPAMLKYDKNVDGTLDDTEKEAIRSTYTEITTYDKNKDGLISEEELAEIAKPPAPPAETRRKKKKKNK